MWSLRYAFLRIVTFFLSIHICASNLQDVDHCLDWVRAFISLRNLIDADDKDIWERADHGDMVSLIIDGINATPLNFEEIAGVEDNEADIILSSEQRIGALQTVMRMNKVQVKVDLSLQSRFRETIGAEKRLNSNSLSQSKSDSFFGNIWLWIYCRSTSRKEWKDFHHGVPWIKGSL